jgi:hypothetical protein
MKLKRFSRILAAKKGNPRSFLNISSRRSRSTGESWQLGEECNDSGR